MKKLIEKIKEKAKYTKDEIIHEYTSKLESIILDFHSEGFDSIKIIDNLYNNMDDNYISQACELSIAHYFLKMFPNGFLYHVESNLAKSKASHDTKKNFDFSFETEGLRFNVEVKTFNTKPPNEKSLPIKCFLKKEDVHSLYEQGMRPTRNCMPALSRFLRDANDQLVRPKVGMSVIVVCCNNLDEYTDALECFVSHPNGIFYRKESDRIIPSPDELKNIDAIILCNLGFEHNAFFDPKIMFDFYKNNEFTLDGNHVWSYKRSVPVIPMAIPIDIAKINEEDFSTLQKCFFSHTPLIYEIMKTKNLQSQDAVFFVFNEILNGRLGRVINPDPQD